MRIALCDDEPKITEELEQMIQAYGFTRDFEIHCERFTDGHDLLERGKFDLYFLDFCMDAMNGIEVAQALKEKYSHAGTICYLTNYAAAAAQIINQGIHAEGFLKKPIDKKQLWEKLDQFFRLSFFNRLELRQGKRFKTLYAQDILYVQADNKQVKVHCFDGVETFTYLLRDVEKLLPAGLFYRIQRSYLVNFQYVDSYDAKSVTLKNGVTLPLKARDFQRAYHNFMFLFNH